MFYYFVFAFVIVSVIWGPTSQTIQIHEQTQSPTSSSTLLPTSSPTTSSPTLSPTTSRPTSSPIIIPEIVNATISTGPIQNVTSFMDSIPLTYYENYSVIGTNEFIDNSIMIFNNLGFYWIGYSVNIPVPTVSTTSPEFLIGYYMNSSSAYESTKLTGTEYGVGSVLYHTGMNLKFTGSKILQLSLDDSISLSYTYVGPEDAYDASLGTSFISYKLIQTPETYLQVETSGLSGVLLSGNNNGFSIFPPNAFELKMTTPNGISFNSTGNSEFRTGLTGFYFVGYTWGFSGIDFFPTNIGLSMKFCNGNNDVCTYYGGTQLSNWNSIDPIRYDGSAIVYMENVNSTVQLTASCSGFVPCYSESSTSKATSFFEIVQLPFISDFIEFNVNEFPVHGSHQVNFSIPNVEMIREFGNNFYNLTSRGYVRILKSNYYFIYFQVVYPYTYSSTTNIELRDFTIKKFNSQAIFAGGVKNEVFNVGYETILNTFDNFNASVIVSGSYVTYLLEDYYLSAYVGLGAGGHVENITATFQLANFA